MTKKDDDARNRIKMIFEVFRGYKFRSRWTNEARQWLYLAMRSEVRERAKGEGAFETERNICNFRFGKVWKKVVPD